jgi:hypothetical protein
MKEREKMLKGLGGGGKGEEEGGKREMGGFGGNGQNLW